MELIFGYILFPLTFMLGVPPGDVLEVSKLIATKIIANGESRAPYSDTTTGRSFRLTPFAEFVAFDSLATQTAANPEWISGRAQLIASYALCGFGNLASGGISIGILAALAPNRMVDIVRLAPRALITGIVATLSTACIAGESCSDDARSPKSFHLTSCLFLGLLGDQ